MLEHCRRRSADERDLWRALAGYRSSDATALLHADHTRGSIFSRQAALVRENILSQLINAPQCVLGGFDELSQLLQLIGDRLRFVDFLSRLVREQPLGTLGGIIVLLLLLCGIFADVLARYDIIPQDLVILARFFSGSGLL